MKKATKSILPLLYVLLVGNFSLFAKGNVCFEQKEDAELHELTFDNYIDNPNLKLGSIDIEKIIPANNLQKNENIDLSKESKQTSIILQDSSLSAAHEVIKRMIGEKAENISLERIESTGENDICEIEADQGKLTIRGNSATAICYGFNTYLKEACHSMISWSGKHLDIPDQWPNYKKKRIVSPYQYRYYLNVVTFGYTTPYWDWNRWEEELDWMALHGINMPLALVGSEAIAERVWLKLGLSKDEIRKFFTGPAYLPWHRMGNLNQWDGPLSDDWQQKQEQLQHKILQRMRKLGMHPIAPAFAGFVPPGFKKLHPEVKMNELKWGGFPDENHAFVLSPESPFFKEIGKQFIQEWEKEFGKNDLYLSDSFNEMDVPVSEDHPEQKYQLLANYGKAIYQSIAAGNPDAVWVTQGWTFGYQHKFWDKPSLKAMLSQVPDDKMLIIDLGNEYPEYVWKIPPVWQTHEGFYGKQWVYSFVPNFGGKTPYTGVLSLYASGSVIALQSPYSKTMKGFGFAPEGIENNEMIYELLSDMGWTTQEINLNKWIADYCIARYGAYPDNMKKAWEGLLQTCYDTFTPYPRFLWQLVKPDNRRRGSVNSDHRFLQAVEKFLDCSDQLKESELYRNDAIELAAFYLSIKADDYYKKALESLENHHEAPMKNDGGKAIQLLQEVDKLLASHPLYRLDSWVNFARNQGTTEKEKDYYESDAKRLITTWGGLQNDYAARVWSGLIRDYYIPRIELYLAHNEKDLPAWEEHWIKTPGISSVVPYKDPVDTAIKLVKSVSDQTDKFK